MLEAKFRDITLHISEIFVEDKNLCKNVVRIAS